MGEQALMDEVAAEIKAVCAKLEEVEAEIKQARAEHNNEEVAALRTKEEQLRKKEEQLRKKEEQLREEKLLLLQRQPGARCYVWRRFAEHLIVCPPRSELCSSCAATACGCSREQRAGADH